MILDALTDFFNLFRGQLDTIPRENIAGELYFYLNLVLQFTATFLGGIGENFSIFNLFGGGGRF